jgi:beta-glucosidase
MQTTSSSGVYAGALVALVTATVVGGACTSRPDRPIMLANAGTSVTGTTGGNGSPTGVSGGNGTGGTGTGGNGTPNGGNNPGLGGMTMVGADDVTCTTYTAPRYAKLTPEDPIVAQKMAGLTQAQMIELMHGGNEEPIPWDQSSFTGNGVQAAGIKEFIMRDGPRGVRAVVGEYQATSFAVAEARAASFDLDLEYRVGKVQGIEMKALHLDLMLAPTINVLRHPAWARAQETYGEDPVVLGEMGTAYTLGLQESVPACPKHFAGNNTDENRMTVKATVDEKTLREVYLRAFQMVVEKSDPACIMAAYNGINGEWCTENKHLLTEILKDEWQWKGFVLSDWEATKGNGVLSANAGLDHEQPTYAAFKQLPGAVPPARIQDAARRILNARAKFGQLAEGYRSGSPKLDIAQTQAHKDLARESAEKGAVLLKNDAILPIAMGKSIVVLGPDAEMPKADTKMGVHGHGDRGSSNVSPPYAVSFAAGIKARGMTAGATVTVDTAMNAAAAAGKDVVIIPVTMAHEDEGEAFGGGGDRATLTLDGVHPVHWMNKKPSAFIREVAAVNPNVIVVLAVGSAIMVEDWYGSVKGIVQTFYPGQEGGTALARLLFGDVNFSAKLPFTVASDASHYPSFDNTATTTTYEYLHGYRRLEAAGQKPRFPFGFGLSYTKYEYSDPKVLCSQGISETGRLNVEVTVKNVGTVAGEEIVMLFIKPPVDAAIKRPPKELKAFTRVAIPPGESKTVQLSVAAKDMNHWTTAGWAVQKGMHTVLVGPSSDNDVLKSAPFTIN